MEIQRWKQNGSMQTEPDGEYVTYEDAEKDKAEALDMAKLREALCVTHGKIADTAAELLSKDIPCMTIAEIQIFAETIKEKLKCICTLSDYAKTTGQHMEDRLYKYCATIESLGFKRKG